MPISSTEINQLAMFQQQMFSHNMAFAQQMSPYNYQYTPGMDDYNRAASKIPSAITSAASFAAPAVAMAGGLMGSSVLDPFTGGMRGFARGVGWRSGAGLGVNLGNMFSGGIGGIARGIGFGAIGALPGMAIQQAIGYTAGQITEGAQFQNRMSDVLQRNFRFTNPMSESGYGFGQLDQRQIGRMVQDMGTRDIMTTPQELTRIIEQGAGMGLFRGVQDAREFKRKFTEVKNTLKEIASTFNSSLSEALPFLNQARQMGFWTPQDVMRHSRDVRQVQAATGMTAQQVQGSMALGAQMVRSIGGTGQQGARMMARSQGIAGAATFGDVISQQQLADAGFGTGEEGTQNLGNFLGGLSTNFARSRTGRWVLAALMNKQGTGLDKAGLAAFASGGLSIGKIGDLARRNVSGGGAYKFVENEEELRGQLAQAGPEAALGIAQSLVGQRLWSDSSRDNLITRRVIQRFFGGSTREADIIKQMMRDMPKLMSIQAARTEGSLDAQERQREGVMGGTYEGLKRRMGQWWEETVNAPLKEIGANMASSWSKAYQRMTDKMFGTGGRNTGLAAEAVRAMALSARTGNMSYINEMMGAPGLLSKELGGTGPLGVSAMGAKQMERMGYTPTSSSPIFSTGAIGVAAGAGAAGAFFGGIGALPGAAAAIGMYGVNLAGNIFGAGRKYSAEDIEEARNLMSASTGVVGIPEARALRFGSVDEMRGAMGGTAAKNLQEYLRGSDALKIRARYGGQLGSRQIDYSREILGRVRAGAAGGAAKDLVAGLGEREAIGRMMAVTGEKGGWAGLGNYYGEGLEGVSDRSRVWEYQNKMDKGLAAALSDGGAAIKPGIGGGMIELGSDSLFRRDRKPGVQYSQKSVEELRNDPKGKEAMVLFERARVAESSGDREKAESLRRKAREMFNELASEPNNGLSEDARKVAIKMGDASDPRRKAIEKAAADAGRGVQLNYQVGFTEQVRRRRDRVRKALKGDAGDTIRQIAGESGTALRDAFENAIKSDKNLSPQEYVAQTRELARLAVENPEKAAEMAAALTQEGLGGAEVTQILSGGAGLAADAKKFGVTDKEEGQLARGGGSGLRKANSGLSKTLYNLGFGEMDSKTLSGLIRGEAGAQEVLRKRMIEQKYKEEDITDFLKDVKGGLTSREIIKSGINTISGNALTQQSEQVAKEHGLAKGDLNLTGREGSTKGIHETLKAHTVWFEKMHRVLERIRVNDTAPAPHNQGGKS